MSKTYIFGPPTLACLTLLLALAGAAEATFVQSLENETQFSGYSTRKCGGSSKLGSVLFVVDGCLGAPHGAFSATRLHLPIKNMNCG